MKLGVGKGAQTALAQNKKKNRYATRSFTKIKFITCVGHPNINKNTKKKKIY